MPGPLQIALVVLLILVLFGRGKISELMGDVAKGITSFRKGLKDDETASAASDPVDVTPAIDAKAAAEAPVAEKASADESKG